MTSRSSLYYAKYKEAGICITCTNTPALPIRSMCAGCLERKREATRLWRKNNPTYKEDRSRWLEDNKERLKEQRRIKAITKYGITEEEFKQLLYRQNYSCAICKIEFDDKINIDHDHTTNNVRGLLCTQCNFLLGNSHDSVNILKEAILYLKGDKE